MSKPNQLSQPIPQILISSVVASAVILFAAYLTEVYTATEQHAGRSTATIVIAE